MSPLGPRTLDGSSRASGAKGATGCQVGIQFGLVGMRGGGGAKPAQEGRNPPHDKTPQNVLRLPRTETRIRIGGWPSLLATLSNPSSETGKYRSGLAATLHLTARDARLVFADRRRHIRGSDAAPVRLGCQPFAIAAGRVLAHLEAVLGEQEGVCVGAGVGIVVDHGSAGLREQRASVIAIGFTQTAAGGIEIPFFTLDPDEGSPHLKSSNAGCAGAHEGIENGFSGIRQMPNAPLHDFQRFLSGMVATLSTGLAKHSVPHVPDQSNGLGQVRPSQLAIGEIIRAVDLIPDQPAFSGGAIVIVTAKNDVPLACSADLSHDFRRHGGVVPGVIAIILGDRQFATRLVRTGGLANPIRRIGHDSIDLAERRQDLAAITQIQRCPPDLFNARHLPLLTREASQQAQGSADACGDEEEGGHRLGLPGVDGGSEFLQRAQINDPTVASATSAIGMAGILINPVRIAALSIALRANHDALFSSGGEPLVTSHPPIDAGLVALAGHARELTIGSSAASVLAVGFQSSRSQP